ncbi:MAG: 1-phosphofructokinase family hexose kinase [Rubellimicrobium sp.]|nr:1-phosphofructokinase family hexose kinase [Rubellimicrobium sp.]
MRDILTVTLNPALDLGTQVGAIVPNVKLRCEPAHLDPGGGGINVSRAIRILGGESRTFVVLGGHNGDHMAKLMREAGLDLIVHPSRGETRSSLSVIDQRTGDQFRFMLPGPEWNALDITAASASIIAAAEPGGLAVISGSIPPGVPDSVLLDLSRGLNARGVDVVVDTSGKALHIMAASDEGVAHVLRMNEEEAAEIAGRPLRDLGESAAFAAALVERGAARIVIVARGSEGSVLATHDRRLHARAPEVPVRSKVGAGDSFVGGFTLGLAMQEDLSQALARGVAAASAAVMTDGTRLCRREDAEALLPRCAAIAI